ncbi:Zn-dependent peptidase ImmA (M78 family)/transcriptional regulator with XRE-family HTH domain [Luteibacter jiangsuensis]|uniref:Zn-dependent peptidase ImmA (M78 family)/transcriptional regulator with XRE-family HTH domain n=1 Tax=Luteibacter jiangsuensis TaxID=637577 RepID=A0ABT9T2W5_9GAMM|nr:XRE family transcriptional regulator [Luteibacter jiangsuensis]MDQ0010542.1 Zn-dependent peptidase ImmA (M78 family)/transcriptional regulator with XRE-family HTH domain [Luteibacter jiangsuensis]
MERNSINPAVLVWARESAGLDLAEAARKIGLSASRNLSPAEKLAQIEQGARAVTASLLECMSKAYHRPLIAFYAATPPPTGERGADFRTLPPDRRREDAPTIDALIRDIKARQALVRELVEDDEGVEPIRFVNSLTMDTPINIAAQAIAGALGFTSREFRRGPVEAGFAYLRELVERTGVFVLLMGNLGSSHTNISAEVFRGFAVADRFAPFVVINDQDAKVSWSFTLLHELVHIWLGESGISGGSADSRIERYCNDVASALLLDQAELERFVWTGDDQALEAINQIAHEARVSRSLVAYRLFRSHVVTEIVWRTLTDRFRQEWLAERERLKAIERSARKEKPGGPSYYVVKRHKLGDALVDLVRRSVTEGNLTPSRAGQVLGVSAMNVQPLISGKAA